MRSTVGSNANKRVAQDIAGFWPERRRHHNGPITADRVGTEHLRTSCIRKDTGSADQEGQGLPRFIQSLVRYSSGAFKPCSSLATRLPPCLFMVHFAKTPDPGVDQFWIYLNFRESLFQLSKGICSRSPCNLCKMKEECP